MADPSQASPLPSRGPSHFCMALSAVSEVCRSAGANHGLHESRPCSDGPLCGIFSRRLLINSGSSGWTAVTCDCSIPATSLCWAHEPPLPFQPLVQAFSHLIVLAELLPSIPCRVPWAGTMGLPQLSLGHVLHQSQRSLRTCVTLQCSACGAAMTEWASAEQFLPLVFCHHSFVLLGS